MSKSLMLSCLLGALLLHTINGEMHQLNEGNTWCGDSSPLPNDYSSIFSTEFVGERYFSQLISGGEEAAFSTYFENEDVLNLIVDSEKPYDDYPNPIASCHIDVLTHNGSPMVNLTWSMPCNTELLGLLRKVDFDYFVVGVRNMPEYDESVEKMYKITTTRDLTALEQKDLKLSFPTCEDLALEEYFRYKVWYKQPGKEKLQLLCNENVRLPGCCSSVGAKMEDCRSWVIPNECPKWMNN